MNVSKKLFLIVPYLLFFSLSHGSYNTITIHANDSTLLVKGKVVDSITNQPVHLASIYLWKDQTDNAPLKTTMTNKTGDFQLAHNHTPFYLKISYMGFQPQTKRIETLNGSNIDIGTIKRHKIDNKLEEVTVSSKRPTLELITGGYKFNADNNVIGNSTNMADLLKQVPGLTVNELEGKLQLLGKGAAVLINGRKVNMGGQDLLNYLKSLSSNDVLSINVLTSPGATYDSSGDGGILDIRLKTGYVTTGLQQKVLQDKLNISLTIEDIFNLQKAPISSLGNVIAIESINKLRSRYAKVSLSYNFGKTFSIKQAKKLEKDSRID